MFKVKFSVEGYRRNKKGKLSKYFSDVCIESFPDSFGSQDLWDKAKELYPDCKIVSVKSPNYGTTFVYFPSDTE